MSSTSKLKGRYELKEVLAKGGMGVVYRGVDGVMKRQVAIKTLLDITDSAVLQLFHKECEVLASMTHPNIIEIYDVGEFDDEGTSRPFLVMPLLPGVTLDRLIRSSSQRLTVERCVDIACQACRGLQAAHEKGMVHRDIKPSNIFVLEDDSIKIIDFGVAHRGEASRTAGRKGTLLYMSPEQIGMKPVSAVSDIFSLGEVCYEMLTRRRPFERASESSVADAILHFVPPPASDLNPAVSRVLSQAIHKAMAKQPWHRYASAKDFADTLQKALRNEPIEIFNISKMRPRLARAQETLERGDYQYASEIVGELEGEGHLDPAITELRKKIDDAIRKKTILHLLDTVHSRIETEEFPLALQRIYEILQLDPTNAEALNLKVEVENKRTERDVEEWYRLTNEHRERGDFGLAREALQRVLQLRPKDPRALQMLSDVNRAEQERNRARQEKDQLYQAALAANQRGDVSSALSKLEKVLELDRQVPSVTDAERSTNYQNLYNQVRSEHENIQRAYAEARHELEAAHFSAALDVCAVQLTKYPENALFQALKIDIEEQQRQAVSARIADINRRADAEPDLDRRIAILEDAVKENPGERHFEDLLLRTREKRNLIESIVLRARMHEQQAQFGDALSQWEILKTIYHRYPGLSMEIDRVIRRRDQHLRSENRNRWVEQIDQLLEGRDYRRALEVLEKAQAEHAGDSELTQLERLAKQGLARQSEAGRLISLSRDEYAAGRYQESVKLLDDALVLDDRNPEVRSALRGSLIEGARALAEQDPSVAGRFLHRALEIDPEDSVARSLLSLIENPRRHPAADPQASDEGGEASSRETHPLHPGASVPEAQQELRPSQHGAGEIERDTATALFPPLETAALSSSVTDYTETVAGPKMPQRQAAGASTSIEQQGPPPGQDTISSATAGNAPVAVPPRQHGRSFTSLLHTRPKLLAAVGVGALIALILIIALVGRKPPKHVSSLPSTLQIISVPAGATIFVNDEAKGAATQPLQLEMKAGSVNIEARMPGYQSARSTASLISGKLSTITLTMVPVLSFKLFIPSGGSVKINLEEPVTVQDGQFFRDLPVGNYAVKISVGRGNIAFTFDVRPDGPAQITTPPQTQEVSALLVSNFGSQTRLFGGNSPVDLKVDGQPRGKVDNNGVDLPNLTPSTHVLELGTGKDLRKQPIDIGPERTLTAIIGSDPNTGRLLVQVNEDDATITILQNAREVRRGVSKKGGFVSYLNAGKYSVAALKDGYEADRGEQNLEIVKGEDTRISFSFRRKPTSASVNIHQTPGSELFVDGVSVGTSQEETRVLSVQAGSRRFRAEKGKQYRPGEKSLEIIAGQSAELDLRLTQAPVPVEIRKDPADSTVTYTRSDDPTVHTFSGTRQELAEGTYTFTAVAKNYSAKVATETISWASQRPIDLRLSPVKPPITMKDWERGGWLSRDAYWEKSGGGFTLFPVPLNYVQFAIRSPGANGRVQWIVHFVNDKNFIRCEIANNVFQAVRISESKDDEVITRKPGIPTSPWYTIRVSFRPDGASFILLRGNEEELLGVISEPGFATTKFGFFVPNGQQLHLTNFQGSAF